MPWMRKAVDSCMATRAGVGGKSGLHRNIQPFRARSWLSFTYKVCGWPQSVKKRRAAIIKSSLKSSTGMHGSKSQLSSVLKSNPITAVEYRVNY